MNRADFDRDLAIPVTFFGSSAWSRNILECVYQPLKEQGLEIVHIVTTPDRVRGRGTEVSGTPVAEFAEAHRIRLSKVSSTQELISVVSKDSHLALLIAFGRIIPKEVIDRFSNGFVNIHPSILPRWRGASPIVSALLAGDTETGISVMQLVPELDAGPVYISSRIPISPTDTTASLEASLSTLACALLTTHLREIALGAITPSPQSHTGVALATKIEKPMGALQSSMTVQEIIHRIRALWPWPKTWFTWKGTDGQEEIVFVQEATPYEDINSEMPVGTIRSIESNLIVRVRDGWIVLKTIGKAGRSLQSAVALLHGWPEFGTGKMK